jgi:uncharacterized membrane protein
MVDFILFVLKIIGMGVITLFALFGLGVFLFMAAHWERKPKK